MGLFSAACKPTPIETLSGLVIRSTRPDIHFSTTYEQWALAGATMVSEDETRPGANSGGDGFDGRDLLMGRPEEGKGRPAAGVANSPPDTTPPHPAVQQPAANDEAIAEILETVRATAVRIDTLRDEPGTGHETAEALARETAALTQAVTDARGALAKAAELAARRDGAAETARTLAGVAAALKTQGEALDQRIRATDRQSAAAAHSMQDMNQSATALGDQLRSLRNDLSRIAERLRWRYWRFGPAVAGAAFVFFALGAVLQREADVMSFGDPRLAWNDFVAEHYAPSLAICASKARLDERTIRCGLDIDPSLDVTVPFYPGTLTKVSSEGEFDPVAEQ